MAQYIDKDAVVAKIKKLIRENELYLSENVSDTVRFNKTGAYSVLNDLLYFLDTPEVKEVKVNTIFPELKETEDERIRKAITALIEFVLEDKSAVAPGYNITKEEAIAWLEKQGVNKEYVFRPVAGTVIENAIEQALRQGDIVLSFNGFYTYT